MTNSVCPYCRAPIDTQAEESLTCEACDTPHHRDCFEENGGCTVFGCKSAPADEPKLRIGTPDLSPVAPTEPITITQPSMLGLAAPVFIPSSAAEVRVQIDGERKAKSTFVLLGVILGALGAHSFYAGYKKKGVAQLCITVLTLGYAAPMSWIWAIIDVCTVGQDSNGVQFKS